MENALKIFIPAALSFLTGILLTPIATHYFYKYKMWRKTSRKENGQSAEFQKIYEDSELRTPRTGGMIIWLSVVITIFTFGVIHFFFHTAVTDKLYFLSRSQTVLPFFSLVVASLIGLGDDFLQIFGRGNWVNDPIVLRYIKIGIIVFLGMVIGYWFFGKLGISHLYIPWFGFVELGFLFIPFFILIMLGVFSASIIDGLDGLSGGVIASIFMAYTLIAFFNNQIDLATFCAVVTGATLAFLWFNIPPARFYMGESGMIGLTVTISVVAFLTNTVLLLPIIAFPLFVTSLSAIIQMLSRRFRNGKKVFLVAPLHHHLEARGWPKQKVTMRYWIVGIVSAVIGVILSLIN